MKYYLASPLFFCLLLLSSQISYSEEQNGFHRDQVPGTWETSWHATFYGVREIKTYIPSKRKDGQAPRALILALHGCLQNAETFNGGASLVKQAEENNVILVMPQQPESSNIYRCWNWFYSSSQNGLGEAAFLVDLVRSSERKYNTLRGHNFVLGMSAGAAMSLVLANCYPQDFKAVASHHGIPYRALMNSWQAQKVFTEGPQVQPIKSAQLGFQCMGGHSLDKLMPAIIIQGTKGTMSLAHAPTAEKQILYFNDLIHNAKLDSSLTLQKKVRRISNQSPYPYTETLWLTAEGHPLVKRIEIEGLGHSWSGGDNTYDFNDPHGPKATEMIFHFFKIWSL